MTDTKFGRKEFLKKVAGAEEEKAPNIIDKKGELFQKYSRKSLAARVNNPNESIEVNDTNPADTDTADRVGNVTSGLTLYTGTWGVKEAIHLLKRTSFGNRKQDVDYLLTFTNASAAIDALMTFSATPTLPTVTPVNDYQALTADPYIPLGSSWVQHNLDYNPAPGTASHNLIESRRVKSLKNWMWGVWLNDTVNMREKLMLFWYHFIPFDIFALRPMSFNAVTMASDYFTMLRNNCTGSLKDLIKEITKSPAMLFYLSNHYSTATNPNENYARELLELFLIGKDPQNYTEDDVQAAAKVLSGWRRTSAGNAPYPHVSGFQAYRHNQTNKTFSAFFNNTTITNQAGANGALEFDQFFDMLFTQQDVAISQYICRRLYRFFVYYDIDSNIETNIIVPLATMLRTNNWNMGVIMKALFKSEHFFDMANRGVMIKSPFDFMIGALRTMEVDLTPTITANYLRDQYKMWQSLDDTCDNLLGQATAEIPGVAGWLAYYQAPSYYQNWINSATMQNRVKIKNEFLDGFWVYSVHLKMKGLDFITQFPNASVQDPNFVVDTFIEYLLPLDLDAAQKTQIKQQTLLSGQVSDYYWSSAWLNYSQNPTNSTYITTIENKLRALVDAIMSLAEFQLM